MKEKVQTLQDFGEILHEVRSEMHYATDLLASDLKASKSLFGGVWTGKSHNIEHYIRVFRHLYAEAHTDAQRRRLDEALYALFHPGWYAKKDANMILIHKKITFLE